MICYCFSNSESLNKDNVVPFLTGAGNLVIAEVDGSGELNPLASATTSKVSQAIVPRVRSPEEKNNQQGLRTEAGIIGKCTGLDGLQLRMLRELASI